MASNPVHLESAPAKRPSVPEWETARDDAEELFALIELTVDSDMFDSLAKRGMRAVAGVAKRHMQSLNDLVEREYEARDAEKTASDVT